MFSNAAFNGEILRKNTALTKYFTTVSSAGAKWVLADRGYDTYWFRDALLEKGIKPCIPAKKNRKQKIKFNGKLYKQRHKVENMFGETQGLATCSDPI